MPFALEELLAPYKRAISGEEVVMSKDPVYETLFPALESMAFDSTAPAMGGAKSLRALAAKYGWDSGAQWQAIQELLSRESGGNRFAQNPTSSAYGRWQFLDSTWAGVGGEKTSNRRLQDIYGLKYLDQRYGSPLEALAFHTANNYY